MSIFSTGRMQNGRGSTWGGPCGAHSSGLKMSQLFTAKFSGLGGRNNTLWLFGSYSRHLIVSVVEVSTLYYLKKSKNREKMLKQGVWVFLQCGIASSLQHVFGAHQDAHKQMKKYSSKLGFKQSNGCLPPIPIRRPFKWMSWVSLEPGCLVT